MSVEFPCKPSLKGATSDRPYLLPVFHPGTSPLHHHQPYLPLILSTTLPNPQPSPSSITRKKHIAQDRKVRTHPALVFLYPYVHEPFTHCLTLLLSKIPENCTPRCVFSLHLLVYLESKRTLRFPKFVLKIGLLNP